MKAASTIDVFRRAEDADVRLIASGFGFLAAAFGAWFLRGYVSRPVYASFPSSLLIVFAGYMFAVVLIAALLTAAIFLANDNDGLHARWFAIHVGTSGSWLIPASLLSVWGLWGAIAGGIVAAIAAAVCLRPCIDIAAPVPTSRAPVEVIALTTSLHAAVFSAVTGKEGIGIALTVLGVFVFTWHMLTVREPAIREPGKSRIARWRVGSIAVCLFITLAVAALTASRNTWVLGKAEDDNTSQKQSHRDPQYRHSGVILRPEKRIYTLIAPVPRQRAATLQAAKPTPFALPFSGDYWFYTPGFAQWKDRVIQRWRPPDDARVENGNPLIWNLSLPSATLIMKAHQPLSQTLDLSCCSAIEVTVENAYNPAPTALIELLLVDSQLRPGLAQSAGNVAVPKNLSTATLRFAIPNEGRVRQFDVLELEFVGGAMHRSRNLNIAVREFRFIPR